MIAIARVEANHEAIVDEVLRAAAGVEREAAVIADGDRLTVHGPLDGAIEIRLGIPHACSQVGDESRLGVDVPHGVDINCREVDVDIATRKARDRIRVEAEGRFDAPGLGKVVSVADAIHDIVVDLGRLTRYRGIRQVIAKQLAGVDMRFVRSGLDLSHGRRSAQARARWQTPGPLQLQFSSSSLHLPRWLVNSPRKVSDPSSPEQSTFR